MVCSCPQFQVSTLTGSIVQLYAYLHVYVHMYTTDYFVFYFEGPLVTAMSLYCIINGDDLYETCNKIDTPLPILKIFSQVYLCIFMFLFIYIVLSLFIGIFNHAYESLSVSVCSYIMCGNSVMAVSTYVHELYYVTGFTKRGLIHASDFANLMRHNFVYG